MAAEDRFRRELKKARQIKIGVTGRTTGRTITLPVWFVAQENEIWLLPVHGSRTQWYLNLLADPTIAVQAGKERRDFRATALKAVSSVRKVIRWFGEKYTPETITKLYEGPLNVAVRIRIS